MFALTTIFDEDVADRLSARFQLRIDNDRFRGEVRGGHFGIERGEANGADVTITTDAPTLQALVFEGMPLSQAEREGSATIEGDRRTIEHLLGCFPPEARPDL